MIMALTAAALGSGLTGCQGDEPAAPPPAPTGNFNYPMGITTDGTYLYIADTKNSTIRQVEIATPHTITTLAGTAGQVGSLDETGAAARFNSPRYLTIDTGILYVAGGWDYKVRKVVIASTVVTTLAGTGVAGSKDTSETGDGTELFQGPMGITQIGTDLYIIDRGAKVLRHVAMADGTTDTPALNPTDPFNSPYGITACGTDLYVANTFDGTILKIDTLTTPMPVGIFAGQTGVLGYDIGHRLTKARFMSPTGIVCNGTNLYVTDTGNSTVMKIDTLTDMVTLVAGTAGMTGDADGTGAAALFKYPFGITTDGTNLYVTDTHNHTIRQIVISSGAVTTIAGIAGEPGSLDSP